MVLLIEQRHMNPKAHGEIVSKALHEIGNALLSEHEMHIVSGAMAEGYSELFGVRLNLFGLTHFYSPLKQKGFPFLNDARKKGTDYFEKAVSLYSAGKKEKAFEFLGRSAHILSDLANPSHSRLSVHGKKDAFESVDFNLPGANGHEPLRKNVSEYFDEIAAISFCFRPVRIRHALSAEEKYKIDYQQNFLLGKAVSFTSSLLLHFMMDIAEKNKK